MQLTFHLFRKDIQKFDDAIHKRKLRGPSRFRPVKLINVPFVGEAYVQRDRKSEPPWYPYIRNNCDPNDLGSLENRGCSFTLLLKTSGRVFAVTMGHGHVLLREDAYEQDFGLRVTMNSVGKNQLRGVQSRNFGASPVHKYLVASRESGRGAFDIDSYLELLASLEGVVDGADMRRSKAATAKNKKLLGTRVSGSTSCSLRHHASFSELATKCDELGKAFDSKAYKQLFPEYDNIRLVTDAPTVALLRQKLVDLVVARDASLSMILPDISMRGVIDHFRIKYPNYDAGELTDLDTVELFDWLKEHKRSGKSILEMEIVGIGDDGRAVTSAIPFERTAVWEGEHNGTVYALTLGRWYRLNANYVKSKNAEFKSKLKGCIISSSSYLPLFPKSIATKKGKKVEREGLYNEHVCTKLGPNYCLMDKKFVKMSTSIEVCDIFTQKAEFIHVKRGTANASMSHLFSQASVSARLFYDSDHYRKEFRTKLPAALQGLVEVKAPQPEKFVVVFAIIERSGSFPSRLSFFKKLNLLHHLRIITSMQFGVKFFSVGCEP